MMKNVKRFAKSCLIISFKELFDWKVFHQKKILLNIKITAKYKY
jgi:hypothetical protein